MSWLGRLDSNQRADGVKVRCLTAWRRPNIILPILTTIYFTISDSFCQVRKAIFYILFIQEPIVPTAKMIHEKFPTILDKVSHKIYNDIRC